MNDRKLPYPNWLLFSLLIVASTLISLHIYNTSNLNTRNVFVFVVLGGYFIILVHIFIRQDKKHRQEQQQFKDNFKEMHHQLHNKITDTVKNFEHLEKQLKNMLEENKKRKKTE